MSSSADILRQWSEILEGAGYQDGGELNDIAGKIERLLAIEAAAQEFRRVTDQAWRDGKYSHEINNVHQQMLWRALDAESDKEAPDD